MITSKILSKQKKIKHGFFNRIGGKSSGIYKSLNCGPGSKDFKSKIKENLKIVKNTFNKKSKDIFLMHQMHSNKIFYINKNFKFSKKKFKLMLLLQIKDKYP